MLLQEHDKIILGRDIQTQLVVHMARFDSVLRDAVRVLNVTDFDWPVAQFVATALFRYYQKYGKVPAYGILCSVLSEQFSAPDVCRLHELELPSMEELMALIRHEPESGLNAAWAIDVMRHYKQRLMLARFAQDASMAVQAGGDITEVLAKAGSLTVGLEQDGVPFHFGFDTEGFAKNKASIRRIPLGLRTLDTSIGGGIAPGELFMLMALQGVGKTNALLNFCMSAARRKWYNLVMSLEMPGVTMRERLVAMAAHIPAMKFRTGGLEELTQEERNRVAMVQASSLSNHIMIADYSAKICMFEDLVEYIKRWLGLLEQRGLRDKAGLVGIDYVSYINLADTPKHKTNTDPDVVKKIYDRTKKEIASALGVAVCILSQTTRKAEGNQILNRTHAAWSFHANDAIDFGFGLAPKEDLRHMHLDNNDNLSGAEEVTQKGKQLIMSSFKARVGDTTAFPFYQANTLRFYDSQGDYQHAERLIREGLFVI
jgi:KaiC/GvpD/RAD55 family RecA-like ATPase